MYINVFDSHTHSDNSFDGHHAISFLSETVDQKNMMGFCVTDHYECNMPDDKHNIRLRDSVFETAMARAAFQDRLLIMTGIELGQATENLEMAEKILKESKFDLVLGSLHNLPGQQDLCYMDFRQVDVPALLREYYTNVLELCRWGKFDVLAHLTYPLRYITGIQKISVDLSPLDDLFREILSTLADKGMGLEINTSTLRQGLGDAMPGLQYLKMFRELGGEYITIGSDAHYAEHIGAHIEDGMDLALEAGFRSFAIYHKRKPQLYPIR